MAVFCSAISSLVGGGASLGVFWAIGILHDICRDTALPYPARGSAVMIGLSKIEY